MDKKLRFKILPIAGVRNNTQRMMEYRRRAWHGGSQSIELYSPRVPKRRRLLSPEFTGSLLAAVAYGLIATAIFVSWSNP